MRLPPDWIVPDWPAPACVRAVCTTRVGGVSDSPYDSLNLGDHVGDDEAAVSRNRRMLEDALGAHPVFLQQVHGVQALELDTTSPDGQTADACFSMRPGVACTIMVADCLPVLLTDAQGRGVAAAHAGWRGLAGRDGLGVLESLVGAFRGRIDGANGPSADSGESELIAWLGPCIGPQAFEVGSEVREAFVAGDPGAAALFQGLGNGKFLADLQALARRRLRSLGITRIHGNDGSAAWCTVANPSRFFSHRRDAVARGGSGRLAACVWLTGVGR